MKQLGDWASLANHSKRIELIVPLWVVKASLPVTRLYYGLRHKVPLFTSYALETLESNSNFDNSKAKKSLALQPGQ